jgi:hypothetical protein
MGYGQKPFYDAPWSELDDSLNSLILPECFGALQVGNEGHFTKNMQVPSIGVRNSELAVEI